MLHTRKKLGGSIALFGGTFNPPHHGHLLIAREALHRLNLARVIFIPSASPPHKHAGPLASARARLAMVKLAVKTYKRFAVSSIEMRRPGLSFTYDTVQAMRRRFPRRTLYFLIGADTIVELKTWYRYRALLKQIQFVVVSRPGYALQPLHGFRKRFTPLPVRGLKASSTEVRARLARGQRSVPELPPRVAAYIRRQGLYRSHAP